jgi:hypothetical protein
LRNPATGAMENKTVSLNAQQTKLKNIIDEEFISLLMDEQWGIRGGIDNVISLSDFLAELSQDGALDVCPLLTKPEDSGGSKTAKFQPSGQGEVQLVYKLNGEDYMLVLNYKRDVDDEIDDDAGKSTGRRIHVWSEVGGYVRISKKNEALQVELGAD